MLPIRPALKACAPRARVPRRALALLLASAGALGAAGIDDAPSRAEIDARLREGIALNLAGDWDAAERVFAGIRARAPDHPGGYGFGATCFFWRTDLDPADPSYDERISELLERGAEVAAARVEEDPDDALWQHYRGQLLGYQSRLDAQRGRFYSAGSRGERARRHNERALALDPGFGDPKASLGPYLYFADLIPGALKWLSFLWFVPEGDRERGLALLEEAAEESRVNRLGARYGLLRLYARYEPERRDEAHALLAELRGRFPDNAVLHVEQLRLLASEGRADEAARVARAIERKSAAGVATYGRKAATHARIWHARAELMAGDTAAATRLLDAIPAPEIEHLHMARAWIELTRGQILDLAGERDAAEDRYEEVVDLDGLERDPHARSLAERYLDAPFTR